MNNPTTSKNFTIERIILQQSIIIEDIRLLRVWVEEQIADTKLETSAQIKATQGAIAELRSEIAGLRQDLKVLIRSVPTA